MPSAAKTGSGDAAAAGTSKSSKVKKEHLQNPSRIEIITGHRRMQSKIKGRRGSGRNAAAVVVSLSGAQSGKTTQNEKLPKKWKDLKSITLNEMMPLESCTDRVLYVTLIEDPMLGFTPIHQIAQDGNGDVVRLFIHEVPHTREMCALYCFGRQLAIINPFVSITLDGRSGIRVENPKSIIVLGKKKNMCRYCGKQNAALFCKSCHRALYCSRECRKSDLDFLEHNRICNGNGDQTTKQDLSVLSLLLIFVMIMAFYLVFIIIIGYT